jgi:hypothetical protein
MSAYVSIRQQGLRYGLAAVIIAAARLLRHTPAYVSIRQHASAELWRYAIAAVISRCEAVSLMFIYTYNVSILEPTSAYVSTCQHMSACVSICQHMSAYVSMRQHSLRYGIAAGISRIFVVSYTCEVDVHRAVPYLKV